MIRHLSLLLFIFLMLGGCAEKGEDGSLISAEQRIAQAHVILQAVVEGSTQIYQKWFNDSGYIVQEEFSPAALSSPFNGTWMLFSSCDTAMTPGGMEVVDYSYDTTAGYRLTHISLRGCPVEILVENIDSHDGLLAQQIYLDTGGVEVAKRVFEYKQPGLLEKVVYIVGGDSISSSFYQYKGNRLVETIRHDHVSKRHLTIKYGREGLPVEAFVMEGEDKIKGYYEFRSVHKGESKKAIQLLEPQ